MGEQSPGTRALVGDNAQHVGDGDEKASATVVAQQQALTRRQLHDAMNHQMPVDEHRGQPPHHRRLRGVDANPVTLPDERPHALAENLHLHRPPPAQHLRSQVDGCSRLHTGHGSPSSSARRRTSVQ